MALSFSGYTACEQKRAVAAFGLNHRIRARARILDLDHVLIRDISAMLTDGQVNLNSASGGVSRNATVSLFDPTHRVGLDTQNPAEGSVSPRYLLYLTRGMYVESVGRWLDLPLGCLYITKPDRDGDVLTIEAQGKEALALFPVVTPVTFKKGTRKTEALAAIMASIGETRMDIASSTAVFSSDFVMDRSTTPWACIKRIANSMLWNAFYDARGRFVARPRSATPVYTFSSGTGGTLLSNVKTGYDTASTSDRVIATGGTPSGASQPLTAIATAPDTHPMSIFRDGKRIFRTVEVSDERALTKAAVQQLADDALALAVIENTTATFDSLPVWHLEEGDAIAIHDDVQGLLLTTFYTQASLPVRLGAQANGTTKRIGRPRPLLRRAA